MTGPKVALTRVLFLAGVLVCGPTRGATYCVATTGGQTPPYTDWDSAFTNLLDAVAYATNGDTLWVTNGLYGITSSVVLAKGVCLQSVNGYSNTIIAREGGALFRCLFLSHSNAVVDGFTISNGYQTAGGIANYGSGVFIATNGTVRNCLITSNWAAWVGGVYFLGGGLVSNCAIRGNAGPAGGTSGSGAYLNGGGTLTCSVVENNSGGGGVYISAGGSVVSSTIRSNAANDASGSGVVMVGGVLRNCLIVSNALCRYGAGVYMTGGSVENCTIVANSATSAGGGLFATGGGMTNTILYANYTASPGERNWVTNGTVAFTRCCSTPLLAGVGNLGTDPWLMEASSGQQYRLAPGSPCIDAGTNRSWMTGAQDLDGHSRLIGPAVDMGAFEFDTNTPLTCFFAASPSEGVQPMSAVLSGGASGSNLTGLVWQWDFTADGNPDLSDAGLATVTNVYTAGVYSVRLSVTNLAGEFSTCMRSNYLLVGPAIAYVATNGLNLWPYTNWVTAATNLTNAIAAARLGTLVLVSDGVHRVSGMLNLNNGITVRGLHGASNTILRSSASAGYVAWLQHPAAVLEGVTLTAGSAGSQAFYILGAGTVTDCIISNFQSTSSAECLVLSRGGTMRNCYVANCISRTAPVTIACYNNQSGLLYSGLVEKCTFLGNANTLYTNDVGAGAIWMGGGTLRSCLVVSNGGCDFVSGVRCLRGSIENCTVVANKTSSPYPQAVGGIRLDTNARVINTIAASNTNSTTGNLSQWAVINGGQWIGFSHLSPDASAYGPQNSTADPGFKAPAQGNYRLAVISPCVGTGSNLTWMASATGLDGVPCISRVGKVNRGAYAYAPQRSTVFTIY